MLRYRATPISIQYELTAKKGDEVTVVNHDTVPHTVTSGTGSSDPNSAKLFDTSIINGGESATISLAQVDPENMISTA